LAKRIERGDPGINPLDRHCKEHDIFYSQHKDVESRNKADEVLERGAWGRVLARDASLGEKAAALAIGTAMHAKRKLGMGAKVPLRRIVMAAKKGMKKRGDKIQHALKAARAAVRHAGGSRKIVVPRVLPIPSKIGGALRLIPLFAALGAIGSLAGGASGIAKAVNEAKAARENLRESQRHNKTMEAIAIGKGLYIRPHKKGSGLYLKPWPKNS